MSKSLKFGCGNFAFRKQALLRAKLPLDFSYETNVKNFEIYGTQPDFTDRKIIFEIDDALYRFVNGILDPYPYRGNIDDILIYGNSVGELLALDNIPAFVNKKVYPIIALDAPADSPVFPKIKIACKVSSYDDVYTKYDFSPVFNLADNAKIIHILHNITTTGNATAVLDCRINKLSGWSDWITLPQAFNQIATQIQFRVRYVLTTLDGTDSVSVDSVTVNFIPDFNKSAATFQTFFSKTEIFQADLKTCYLLIKHSPLIDSHIEAFVNLNPPPKRRENLYLGKTSGSLQTVYLPDKFLAQDSLHIEIDGNPFFDFDFDTDSAALTLQADPNLNIYASYDFFQAEHWTPMTLDFADLNQSRFTFTTDNSNLREAAVRFSLISNSGTSHSVSTGTGALQSFSLEHNVTSLTCNVPFAISGNVLNILAPVNSPVDFSYNWRGLIPAVSSFIAGFSV